MAVRVDREVFDPVAVSSTAGSVQVYDDGTRQSPWQPRPFQSTTESVISESLRLMSIPADVIRQTRPVVPQQLFPETLGYDDTPLTIEDVLATDRWAPQIRSWTSGTRQPPRRVDIMEDTWSGTLRGFNNSADVRG